MLETEYTYYKYIQSPAEKTSLLDNPQVKRSLQRNNSHILVQTTVKSLSTREEKTSKYWLQILHFLV